MSKTTQSTIRPIPSLSRNNLAQQVIKQIIDLIMSNEFRPGERLPGMLELSRQFGVCRAVVREAIGVLAAQGFLQVVHGSGTYVSPADKWNTIYPRALRIEDESIIDELMKAREHIEPYLAYLAAQRATAGDLAAIESTIRLGCAPSDTLEFDVAFHAAVARASHNEVLAIMLASIEEFMTELRTLGYTLFPETQAQSLACHQTIFGMIRLGNADGAAEAMDAHLREAHEGFLNVIVARQASQDTGEL